MKTEKHNDLMELIERPEIATKYSRETNPSPKGNKKGNKQEQTMIERAMNKNHVIALEDFL